MGRPGRPSTPRGPSSGDWPSAGAAAAGSSAFGAFFADASAADVPAAVAAVERALRSPVALARAAPVRLEGFSSCERAHSASFPSPAAGSLARVAIARHVALGPPAPGRRCRSHRRRIPPQSEPRSRPRPSPVVASGNGRAAPTYARQYLQEEQPKDRRRRAFSVTRTGRCLHQEPVHRGPYPRDMIRTTSEAAAGRAERPALCLVFRRASGQTRRGTRRGTRATATRQTTSPATRTPKRAPASASGSAVATRSSGALTLFTTPCTRRPPASCTRRWCGVPREPQGPRSNPCAGGSGQAPPSRRAARRCPAPPRLLAMLSSP